MSVAFGGFHNETATFKVTEEISKGTPVKISDNATVAACGEGDEFCGIITGGDNAYAAVQIYGEVTAKFSGTVIHVPGRRYMASKPGFAVVMA